jgi:hypothetical protein
MRQPRKRFVVRGVAAAILVGHRVDCYSGRSVGTAEEPWMSGDLHTIRIVDTLH